MGIFTWTDATVKSPKCDKYGDYKRKDVVEYGGYAKLICPDNTEIETESHGYYGRIGGYDIYELVAEWNKEYLSADNLEPKPDDPSKYGGLFGFEIDDMKKQGKSDEEIQKADMAERMKYFNADVKRWEEKLSLINEYKSGIPEADLAEKYGEDWKRELGIEIACQDDQARKLKYPIKLTRHKDVHGYENLYISYSCQ